MRDAKVFEPGNYAYLPAVFQYSSGVVALPGYAIERVRFPRPIALAEGFARVAEIIAARQRPLTSFCACELRSPEPFSEAGFKAFNEIYVGTLAQWGIYAGTINPVARSNVCPELHKPAQPSFHAFSFTVVDAAAKPSFVVSGSGEAQEGRGSYAESVVRPGDTSPDGMRAKARAVLSEMERRMAGLGFTWADTTAAQAYTVFDVHGFLADEVVRRGAAEHGLTLQYCRPPVAGLDFEMDCRGVATERVV